MRMTKQHCSGCRNDFYNSENYLGVKECWSFKDAKLVKKIRIHRDEPPPYKQKPVMVPNCRHEQGYVLVNPDALTSEGFWK